MSQNNSLLQLATASNPPIIPRPESSQSNMNLSSSNSTAQLHHLFQHTMYAPPPQLGHMHVGTGTSGPSSASTGTQFNQGFLPNPLPPINDHQLGGGQPVSQQSQQSHHHQQQQSQQQNIMRSMTPLPVMSPNGAMSGVPNQLLNYQNIQEMHLQQQQQQQQQYLFHEQGGRWKKKKLAEFLQHNAGQAEVTSKRTSQESVLKLVALKNKDKPLGQYATIVRNAEIEVLNMDTATNSKSEIQAAEQNRERERQVYALVWLMNNCISESESYVPRGRIFAQYAASCAQNQLKPLSQATLGKLIRSLFPHLKTRRLGMRGQSKYHYCGLKLVSSLASSDALTPTGSSTNERNTPNSETSSTISSAQLDGGITPLIKSDSQSQRQVQNQNPSQKDVLANASITVTSVDSQDETSLNTSLSSNSAGATETPSNSTISNMNHEAFILGSNFFAETCEAKVELPLAFPNLQQFLPRDHQFDADIVSSVESLYQVFCNTLFENIRFTKFDDLPSTLQSFSSSSISTPMYDLFTTEELYPWVSQCDLITHKALTKMLSSLIMEFDDIPDVVLNKLSEFSNNYLNLVQQSTLHLPLPMVTSKKNIAKTFSHLVKRLLKVIETTKHLSHTVSKQEIRLSMLFGWEQNIKLFDIASQEFGYLNDPELEKEVVNLFSVELPTLYRVPDEEFDLISLVKQVCKFMETKNSNARLLVLTLSSFTSACLRDLSLKEVDCLNLWLISKSFLDEWLLWYGEVGGFLNE